jgi:hypothetical protein
MYSVVLHRPIVRTCGSESNRKQSKFECYGLLYVQVMRVIMVLRPPRSFVLMTTELIVRV